MISAQGQRGLQDRLIENLMSLPNSAWDAIISQANQDPSVLQDGETIKIVGNIMKTNVAACSSIGSYFYSQIGRIYHDMLNMYRASSQLISDAVARDGKYPSSASRHGSDINTPQVILQLRLPKFAACGRSRKKS
jgi:exportin-1